MTHNDTLRSIRYLLNVRDSMLIEIAELGGYLITEEEVVAYLKKEEEPGYVKCPDEVMAHFLNGLVIYKRGKDPLRPPPVAETPVSNNDILKKLRVAFQLKDTDLINLIEKNSTLKVSKSELGAFFRHRSHRNYRDCGDQFLRYLLKALAG